MIMEKKDEMTSPDRYMEASGNRRACPHPAHRFPVLPHPERARVILPECAGSAAWLAARQGGIGGSEIGALMGISEYETPFSVWNTKINGGKDLSAVPAVEWGHRLEEVVAAKTAEEVGLVPRFGGGLWAARDRDILRVTPDRFATRPRSWKAVGVIECKGLPLETPIPVPSGWSSIQEIRVGEELFAADGSICRVTGKSEIRWVDCYRLTFDDGSTVVCDADHRWPVVSGRSGRETSQVLDTRQIAGSLVGPDGQRQHRILLAGPIEMPDVDLPVEPYTMGCWLGDGSADSGRITKLDQELFQLISDASGLQVAPIPPANEKCPTRTIYGLAGQLRFAGVLGDKYLPRQYLRAGYGQRIALLQGLMDTDGTPAPTRKQVVFSSVDKQLAHDVEELVLSLGERPVVVEVNGSGFGKPVTSWRVQWRPTRFNPFRLTRKAEKVRVDNRKSRTIRRMIVSAELTITVPTMCLMVDSSDRTYLCDKRFIPTHNTAGDDADWRAGSITRGGQGDGAAPMSYQAQVQWQLGILGLERGWLGCLVLGQARDFFVVEIEFDPVWFNEMADEAERFWSVNVLGEEPPMHDLRHPKTEELMRFQHPKVIKPSVELPEDADEWLADYAVAKAEAEAAEARVNEIKNYFRMHVGDAAAGYLGDQKVVSYPDVTTSRIDVEALKRDFPEVAEKVTVRSTHRRLTIKTPKK